MKADKTEFGKLEEMVQRSILSVIREQDLSDSCRPMTIHALENSGRTWDDSISPNSDYYGTWTVDIFNVAKWLACEYQKTEEKEWEWRQKAYDAYYSGYLDGIRVSDERNPLSRRFWSKMWCRVKARQKRVVERIIVGKSVE